MSKRFGADSMSNSREYMDEMTKSGYSFRNMDLGEQSPKYQTSYNNQQPETFDVHMESQDSADSDEKCSERSGVEESPYVEPTDMQLENRQQMAPLDLDEAKDDAEDGEEVEEDNCNSSNSEKGSQDENSFKTAQPRDYNLDDEEERSMGKFTTQEPSRQNFGFGAEKMGQEDFTDHPWRNSLPFNKFEDLPLTHSVLSRGIVGFGDEPTNNSEPADTQQSSKDNQMGISAMTFTSPNSSLGPTTMKQKREEDYVDVKSDSDESNKEHSTNNTNNFKNDWKDFEDEMASPEEKPKKKEQATFETQTINNAEEAFQTGKVMYPQLPKIKENTEEYDRIHSEDAQFPMARSLARETQTQEDNFYQSDYLSFFDNNTEKIEITIPRTTTVKENLVYSYTLYEMHVKGQDREYVVTRRFKDFIWLYDELSSNYIGYIVPLHPEKNIWTKINHEGPEFSERRKAELLSFVRKLIKHKFLHRTIEFHKFLLDEHAYHDYKNSKKPVKNEDLFGYVTKAVYQGFPNRRRTASAEPSALDTKIRNLDYFLESMEEAVQNILNHLRKYYELKKRHSSEILNASSIIAKLLTKSESYVSKASPIKFDKLSNIEDSHNKSLTKDIDLRFKDIVSNLSAARAAVTKRQEFIDELCMIEQDIANFNLNIKKENRIDSSKLEILKREAKEKEKKLQSATEILVHELTVFKGDLEAEVESALLALNTLQSSYFSELFALWKDATMKDSKKIVIDESVSFNFNLSS